MIRRLARALLGDYQVFVILAVDCAGAAPPDAAATGRLGVYSTPEAPAEGSGYAGPDAIGFEWREDGRRLAWCWVWYGERYRRDRNFWPLGPAEAKLISLETRAEVRGRGIAPQLVAFARHEMARRGFDRLYARVWHSNRASLRAFAKAGWRRHAVVVEVAPLGRRLRLVLPAGLGRRTRGASPAPPVADAAGADVS